MRSRSAPWVWLLRKEWRELLAARAFWVMLLLTGPLVGESFASAVRAYAELSGLHGSAAGVGEAFSPLIGVWSPTFSAYEIVAAFLLPFVVIRVVSGDRQSGALKLELQQPLSPFARMAAKAAVLFGGWLIASAGALLAILLWSSYGGSLHAPEIGAAALGHLLNAGLTIALASAAAGIAEHPATAAILALGFTVATWVVNFAAAVRGGLWEQLAGYTPPVMVAAFQHGLVRLDLTVIALVLSATGLALAAVWLRIGVATRQRVLESFAAIGAASLATFAATFLHPSVDLSENRYNSFAAADERQLERIRAPLRLDVHLAPEDPRRYDLERHALRKLRRAMPSLQVRYLSATSVGLFEQTAEHYGEIRYELAGRTAVNRQTSAEAVLETIYSLAGLEPPPEDHGQVFRGHPLAVPPRGAVLVFDVAWPAAVLAAAYLVLRRTS